MTTRAGRASPRGVLLGALVFVVLGVGLYVAAPWVLPVRILEGPLVQQPTEQAATLIWYTTRALERGGCVLVLETPTGPRTLPATADGTRHRVRVEQLAPGEAYPYHIELDGRTLAEGELHTNKAPGEPFAFIVVGDSGKGTRAQYLLAGQMNARSADFILHAGDVIYSAGERAGFKDRFFAPYRHLLSRVACWPTLGNHDVFTDNGAPYCEVFELPENGPSGQPPEHHYWFEYASARVAVIDSNVDETVLATEVAPWLLRVFADGSTVWRFVLLHHPPYTAGAYKPDGRIQRALVPAFEAAGVDVVFAGHDHLYERTLPLRGGEVVTDGRGVVYVVSGAGGARLYEALSPEERPAWIAALDDTRHSFTHVQITGDTLRLQQIDTEGVVIDDWTMTRPPATQPAAEAPAEP